MKAASLPAFFVANIPIIIGMVSAKTLQIPLWLFILEFAVVSILLMVWWRTHHDETFFGYRKR